MITVKMIHSNLQYNKYESMLPGFRYGKTNMKKGK